MPNARETGYVCAFSTPAGEGETWVRAWTPDQASEMVRALLRDHGVTGDVRVRVRPDRAPRPRRDH